MAETTEIKYIDENGLQVIGDIVKGIRKDLSIVYTIKGNAIFADEIYLSGDHPNEISSEGLWKNNNDNWEKITTKQVGDVYNIINKFITTDEFIEGPGKSIAEGNNIAIVNTGTKESPIYKFDLLSIGLDGVQLKNLSNPLSLYSSTLSFSSSSALPSNEDENSNIITKNTIAIIDSGTEKGDIYKANVYESSNGINVFTWDLIGNVRTVEGAIELFSNIAPRAPITAEDVENMLNS